MSKRNSIGSVPSTPREQVAKKGDGPTERGKKATTKFSTKRM